MYMLYLSFLELVTLMINLVCGMICSLLKVILLQSSEASDTVTETKPVDFISLSGVCLMNNRGIWKIQVGGVKAGRVDVRMHIL